MIYCFDIDGTICSSVEKSDYLNAKPFEDVIQKINELYDEGHKIIFMTARGSVSKKDWTEETIAQLSRWGVKYHELIVNKKPHADFFIDDKAINANDWRRNIKNVP
jgi:uncharacterized HAD superfamily protein